MIELQTMPLRFKVWDKKGQDFYKSAKHEGSSFNLIELSVFLMRQAEAGKPHTDFVISQNTGLFDKNGEYIFTGDIVRVGGEIGVVSVDKGEVVAIGDDRVPLGCWAPEGINHLGNIFENPELSEKESVQTL